MFPVWYVKYILAGLDMFKVDNEDTKTIHKNCTKFQI